MDAPHRSTVALVFLPAVPAAATDPLSAVVGAPRVPVAVELLLLALHALPSRGRLSGAAAAAAASSRSCSASGVPASRWLAVPASQPANSSWYSTWEGSSQPAAVADNAARCVWRNQKGTDMQAGRLPGCSWWDVGKCTGNSCTSDMRDTAGAVVHTLAAGASVSRAASAACRACSCSAGHGVACANASQARACAPQQPPPAVSHRAGCAASMRARCATAAALRLCR